MALQHDCSMSFGFLDSLEALLGVPYGLCTSDSGLLSFATYHDLARGKSRYLPSILRGRRQLAIHPANKTPRPRNNGYCSAPLYSPTSPGGSSEELLLFRSSHVQKSGFTTATDSIDSLPQCIRSEQSRCLPHDTTATDSPATAS